MVSSWFGRLIKKIVAKVETRPPKSCLKGLQTLLFIFNHFGCNLFRIMPRLFPSICILLIEVAVLCNRNLTRRLLQDLDLLLAQNSICNMQICFYVLFSLTAQWMNRKLSKEISTALVCFTFSRKSIEITFPWKRNRCHCPKSIKTFLTFKLSQYWVTRYCVSVRPNHSGFTARLCRQGQRYPGAVWTKELR